MPEPVLVLTGPPGVGKTTVARILAGRAERGVHVRSDEFFYFIESGLIAPWEPESAAQNAVVMDIVAAAAARYAAAGYRTIVDGVVQPGWFYAPLRDALAAHGLAMAYAILSAPLERCAARARGREHLPIEDASIVERIYAGFADPGPLAGHVLPIGDRGPQEVADLVEARLGGLTARTSGE